MAVLLGIPVPAIAFLSLRLSKSIPPSQPIMSTSHYNPSDNIIIAHLTLRKSIGVIGLTLPFILVLGKILLESPGIQPSISGYYYTIMRNIFVGSLCAIGMCLMTYRGYDTEDNITGNFACAFAIGVAIFPTAPDGNISALSDRIGQIHLTCATLLFSTFAYFCLKLFRKTDRAQKMTREKKRRNTIYTVCGRTIISCMGLITLYNLLLKSTWVQHCDPVFWLESIAIVAFAISWLVKGGMGFQD
jgi:hypothetical protein